MEMSKYRLNREFIFLTVNRGGLNEGLRTKMTKMKFKIDFALSWILDWSLCVDCVEFSFSSTEGPGIVIDNF